jgi:hypothetical protein
MAEVGDISIVAGQTDMEIRTEDAQEDATKSVLRPPTLDQLREELQLLVLAALLGPGAKRRRPEKSHAVCAFTIPGSLRSLRFCGFVSLWPLTTRKATQKLPFQSSCVELRRVYPPVPPRTASG